MLIFFQNQCVHIVNDKIAHFTSNLLGSCYFFSPSFLSFCNFFVLMFPFFIVMAWCSQPFPKLQTSCSLKRISDLFVQIWRKFTWWFYLCSVDCFCFNFKWQKKKAAVIVRVTNSMSKALKLFSWNFMRIEHESWVEQAKMCDKKKWIAWDERRKK